MTKQNNLLKLADGNDLMVLLHAVCRLGFNDRELLDDVLISNCKDGKEVQWSKYTPFSPYASSTSSEYRGDIDRLGKALRGYNDDLDQMIEWAAQERDVYLALKNDTTPSRKRVDIPMQTVMVQATQWKVLAGVDCSDAEAIEEKLLTVVRHLENKATTPTTYGVGPSVSEIETMAARLAARFKEKSNAHSSPAA